ncbi:MAG: alpha/beta fold hydrolase [Anaerolineae bacterium]
MSSIVTDQGIVHYEAYGRGQPVILLHGWLGSWGYWLGTMEALKSHFRCYALDFWGFGDSGKRRERYLIDDFVVLVDEFMERLGIDSAPIVGHSMGGTVALSLALENPKRVRKIIVVGSPIVGDSLNIFLRLAGYHWIASLVWNLPTALKLGIKLFSPQIARDSRVWYQMITQDLSRTTLEAFFSSIASLRGTDLRPYLRNINVPTLGVYGRGDNLVALRQAELLAKHVACSQVNIMLGSKHFPMLDEPRLFNQKLADFLLKN